MAKRYLGRIIVGIQRSVARRSVWDENCGLAALQFINADAAAALIGWCATSLANSHFSTFVEGRLLFFWLGAMLANRPMSGGAKSASQVWSRDSHSIDEHGARSGAAPVQGDTSRTG